MARVCSIAYNETLHTRLYAGATHCLNTLKPSVLHTEHLLGLNDRQRARTVWRMDASFGSDAAINDMLSRDYRLLIKGYNSKRAHAVASRLPAEAWYTLRTGRWYASVPNPVRYARRTETVALRWLTMDKKLKHALLIHNLPNHTPQHIVELYDDRGSMETDIREDKAGLQLIKRRKQRWNAQESWIVLTDLAHNLLTWTHDWMFARSCFESFGLLRLVQDVFTIPGQLEFGGAKGDHLTKVALQRSHPFAHDMQACLERLFRKFS